MTVRRACYTWIAILPSMVVVLASCGCARLYHAVHYNCLAEPFSEHSRSYYHSGSTGRIIPKEGYFCWTEPACFGFEPTSWSPWPSECLRCPPVEAVYFEPVQPGRPAGPSEEPLSAPAPATEQSGLPGPADGSIPGLLPAPQSSRQPLPGTAPTDEAMRSEAQRPPGIESFSRTSSSRRATEPHPKISGHGAQSELSRPAPVLEAQNHAPGPIRYSAPSQVVDRAEKAANPGALSRVRALPATMDDDGKHGILAPAAFQTPADEPSVDIGAPQRARHDAPATNQLPLPRFLVPLAHRTSQRGGPRETPATAVGTGQLHGAASQKGQASPSAGPDTTAPESAVPSKKLPDASALDAPGRSTLRFRWTADSNP